METCAKFGKRRQRRILGNGSRTNSTPHSTKPRHAAEPSKIRDVNFSVKGDSYLQGGYARLVRGGDDGLKSKAQRTCEWWGLAAAIQNSEFLGFCRSSA